MGSIETLTRQHYSGLDADKTLITGVKGDTFTATNTGKWYYWNVNLTAWKTGLGYEFVPRTVGAVDFNTGDFTIDGAWHADGLDLTGIVPAGAIAVQLHLDIKDAAADKQGVIRQNDTTHNLNKIDVRTQVGNIWDGKDNPVSIDSNLLMDYYFATGIGFITLTITGWYI